MYRTPPNGCLETGSEFITEIREALIYDVDRAYSLWCQHAECLLWRMPVDADKNNLSDNSVAFDSGQGRGKIAFHKECVFPPCHDASVQTLRARRKSTRQGRGACRTANVAEQLEAIRQAWKPFLDKFANKAPRTQEFLDCFCPLTRGHDVKMQDITGPQLVAAASKLDASTPSLDQWRPESLRALAEWHPSVCNSLALVFNHIELHGKWPQAMDTGHVGLILKQGSDADAVPLSLRPISVLSAIYRLRSSLRFKECLQWQAWAPTGMFVCMHKKGAESMAMAISQELEAPSYEYPQGGFVFGISYDFAKAFDVIPHCIMFACLEK